MILMTLQDTMITQYWTIIVQYGMVLTLEGTNDDTIRFSDGTEEQYGGKNDTLWKNSQL